MFLVLVLLLGVLTANAQVKNWQVKAGGGIAGISGSDAAGSRAKVGWEVGAGFEYGLTPKFSIQPSLMFVGKGYKDSTGKKWDADYLELPVYALYHVSDAFSVEAGPYVACGITGSKDIFKKDSGIRRLDFGIGGGIAYAFGPLSVGLDATYSLQEAEKNVKMHIYSFCAVLGYTF